MPKNPMTLSEKIKHLTYLKSLAAGVEGIHTFTHNFRIVPEIEQLVEEAKGEILTGQLGQAGILMDQAIEGLEKRAQAWIRKWLGHQIVGEREHLINRGLDDVHLLKRLETVFEDLEEFLKTDFSLEGFITKRREVEKKLGPIRAEFEAQLENRRQAIFKAEQAEQERLAAERAEQRRLEQEARAAEQERVVQELQQEAIELLKEFNEVPVPNSPKVRPAAPTDIKKTRPAWVSSSNKSTSEPFGNGLGDHLKELVEA